MDPCDKRVTSTVLGPTGSDFVQHFAHHYARDASILDPQHRHILECSWEALENAAIDPDQFDGPVGVFAGSGHNAYMPYNLLTNPALLDSVGFFVLRHTGNDKDFLTTRISYCLKLTGPSINVQTACSTSLVAVHMASQSLLNNECDLALAGGVTIEMPHRRGYLYKEGEIMSPDGHCRAFDAASQGTLFGSAVGVVALRRYADAVEDRDIIHAVIRGSAVNNDGANKVGYFAPSVEGQAACMSEALAVSEVDPATVTYVECHGTGTPVGDPIEVTALSQAFREETDSIGYCAIGSVKTNIGHTDTAAGICSLIKATQALKHKQLPPNLHFKSPNPSIDLASSPFYVNAALKPWVTNGIPRRAGVNSLGVGGTNAFAVLEEAPERGPSGESREWHLVAFSARSADAVDRAGERLTAHLEAHPDVSLADIAYTHAVARRDFAHRRMVVARDVADAAEALETRDPKRVFTQQAADSRSIAFTFPGGGAQYPNMGRKLYETELVYKQEIDHCLELLGRHVDWDLKSLLFPEPGQEQEAAAALQHGSRTLPSLFITEYALAKQFMAWGIKPTALLGHSMGEYVAACLSGVFSVEDGLRLVLKRGQLFEQVDKGAMLSVPMPSDELAVMIGDDLDIAAVNGPALTVVSGPAAAIDDLRAQLEAKEIDTRQIKIHVAAHSRMLDPILPAFAALTKTIDFKPPKIRFLSNTTGSWITEAEATDPDYWVRHLRSTVQFSDNLQELLSDESRVVLEVAPGRTLSNLAKAHPSAGIGRPVFNSLRHPREEISDIAFLLNVLGRLWLCGVNIDWHAFYSAEDRQRLSLPTYPFEHKPYWIEPGQTQVAPITRSLKKKPDISDWFYQPSWRRQLLPTAPSVAVAVASEEQASPWLVFVEEYGLGDKLVDRLRAAGQAVITVVVGDAFEARGSLSYALRPDSADDYDELWSVLVESDLSPRRVLHLWTTAGEDAPKGLDGLEVEQNRGFYSMLFLAQALGRAGSSDPINIAVISNDMQQVAAEPLLRPERAMVLGPCKVMMQEFPNITCRSIDIVLPKPGSWQEELLLERIPQEVMGLSADHVIAYRGHDRFVQEFQNSRMPEPIAGQSRLRQRGVYLITGGLGGLGLLLAEYLAKAHSARLVLVGRTPLPKRDCWDDYILEHGADDGISRRIQQMRLVEAAGAEVLMEAADVTSLEDMNRVVSNAVERFGSLNGVFHTAGVLDDGIIQMKTREQAAAVLAPKVRGTLVIDAAVKNVDLDFLVLYSSVSAFTGLTGQVDYAAANAFLDAFAHTKTERDGVFTVALDWNAWQQVGMAAELARELGLGVGGVAERPASHPLLDRCLRETTTHRNYVSEIRTDSHWLVDDHRIKGGEALIPGTGYLELARAALAENSLPGKAIEIRNLTFMAPFVVRAEASRELRVSLEREGDAAWKLEITGGPTAAMHASGEVLFIDAPPPVELSISDIMERCQKRKQMIDSTADAHLDFGPRWNNRKSVNYGDSEALVSLELPAKFAGDCPDYGLHPALMDFATAGAQALIPGFAPDTHFYVPLSYGKVVVTAPLQPKVYSHVRLKESSDDVAVYDVTIYDDQGMKLVEISDFVMRRVKDRVVLGELASVGSIEARPDRGPVKNERGTSTANRILMLGLEQGIAPAEGMQVIERVLAGPLTAQLIVSSQDLQALIESTRPAEPWESTVEEGADVIAATKRPNLATQYVAPESKLATTIVGVWEEILGVSGIGIHDDFFDLGGHSLLLMQVLSRVRKQVDTGISLRAMFEKRTVSGIAEEIDKADTGPQAPTLKRVSRDAYRIKRTKN